MHASGFVFTPREMTQRSENLVTYLFFYVSAAWCIVPLNPMPFMACSEVSSIFSGWLLCWTNIIMITAVTYKLCSCFLWLLLWHSSQENWTYIVVNVIVPISLMDSPSIAFLHPPPNSTRTGHTTEWVLFNLCAAIPWLCQRSLKGLGTDTNVEVI